MIRNVMNRSSRHIHVKREKSKVKVEEGLVPLVMTIL